MKTYKLKVKLRENLGSSSAKKYRKEGFIPAVAYGLSEKNLHLLINEMDFYKLLKEIGDETAIVELEYNGNTKKSFIQEIQRDIITGKVIHVDFHIVHEREKVSVSVPVVVKGQENSPGIKKGGILEVHLHSIDIKAFPENIPGHIEIDISNLDIGSVIHVSDIKIENVEFEEDMDEVVLSIIPPRVETETQTEQK
ncbi:MAG: 50S ribosomal protein L25 [candidate division WOR-3 bacterium]|nr:50S ribosomal protein L25 [candidate division WOR-3 bacterium]MCX7947750.1 50S ribosomal protein L25 [candidate division WOR-3 bacterium]MDW8150327.1 50S ribosomal protein L25 [candidate division WOR-3 bacterium]